MLDLLVKLSFVYIIRFGYVLDIDWYLFIGFNLVVMLEFIGRFKLLRRMRCKFFLYGRGGGLCIEVCVCVECNER